MSKILLFLQFSHSMIWHILRYWITFFIPAYYRRIQAKNLHFLKAPGPVIIAMNHPNAFTDPILLTYLAYPQRLKFLARGDAFKPGIISRLLESIGIIPIFRIQDAGREGLLKNDESYRRVNHFLKHNGKIIVFAEGLCVQERRLRPLKKGVARMVYGAYEALNDERLAVVPVCVNYGQPDRFRSNAFYNIGAPIPVKELMPAYRLNPAKANKDFLNLLSQEMKKLLTHINDPANDAIVMRVEEMRKHHLLAQRGLDPNNLEHDFRILTEITEKVNNAAVQSPGILHEFKSLSETYFSELKKEKLSDEVLDPERNAYGSFFLLILRLIVIIAGLPFYLAGLCGNYLPFRVTIAVTKKIVKDVEFFSSFALGVAMIVFFLNYLVIFLVLYFLSGSSLMPVTGCVLLGLCGGFNVFYQPFLVKTMQLARFVIFRRRLQHLTGLRERLVALINKF